MSRGINAAKAKYEVYPSAYANGYAVQVCKGTMPGLDGKKRCSGKYCSGKNKPYICNKLLKMNQVNTNISTLKRRQINLRN